MEFREFLSTGDHVYSWSNRIYRFTDNEPNVTLDIKVSDSDINYCQDHIYIDDEWLQERFDILKENDNERKFFDGKNYYNADWLNLFNSTSLKDCSIIIILSDHLLGIYNAKENMLEDLINDRKYKYISYGEIVIKKMVELRDGI